METENQKIEVNFLAHHGVTGQKWGERRYQNKDGSLTPLGRIHWGIGKARTAVSNKLKTRKSFRLETDSEKRKRLKLKAEKKEENKKLKLQKAEEAKQKKAEAVESKKAKLIAKGDKDAIYKNRELFSDEELDKAMARINKVNQFKTEKVSKSKEHLINRANPREIYANRSQLNDEELDRALRRVDKLKTINPAEKKALEKLQQTKDNRQTAKDGKNTVDKLISAGKTVVTVAGTAVALYEGYNKVASIVNEISGEKKMPTFNLNPWKNKDEKSDTDRIIDALNKNNKGDGDNTASSAGKKSKGSKGDSNNTSQTYNLKQTGKQTNTTANLGDNNGYSTGDSFKLDVDFGGKKPSYTTSTANTGDWASNASTTVGKQGLFNKTKAPSVFDLNSGLMTSKELKAVAKGKSDAAESANIWYNAYNAQKTASKTKFEDLVKSGVSEEYTGNTGYSGTYTTPRHYKDTVPTVTWEKKITDVKPATFAVDEFKNVLYTSGGTKISKIWEDTGQIDAKDADRLTNLYRQHLIDERESRQNAADNRKLIELNNQFMRLMKGE